MNDVNKVLRAAEDIATGEADYSCLAVLAHAGVALAVGYRKLMLDGLHTPKYVEAATAEVGVDARDFRVMLLCMFAAVLKGTGK